MKKLRLLMIGLFINSLLFGQYQSLNPSDTTVFEQITSLKDFQEFGYNYLNKSVMLNVYFKEISNTYLTSIPEVRRGSSNEGFTTFYDPKKVKEFVGLKVCERDETYATSVLCKEMLYNIYGYQSDILEKLKQLKEDDQVVILGKVVKYPNGEEHGIRVKYIYTIDEYNNTVNKEQESVVETNETNETNETTKTTNYTSWIIYGLIGLGTGIFYYFKEKYKSKE